MKRYFNLFIALVLSIVSISAFAAPYHYVIFVDAGSSGSRLHVFRYDGNSKMPGITDMYSKSVKPGLSSYAKDPTDAGKSLKSALDEAVFLLKDKTDPGTVRIYVFGTGGMRSLPRNQERAIYENVEDYIEQNYFPFFASDEVRTISGSEEALYGWLDVNYLEGNFQNRKPTVGSIDMGGASTQIAFETQDDISPDLMNLIINNQKYRVYVKSFQGLGQDLAQATMTKDPRANACYPLDYEFEPGSTGVFNLSSCGVLYKGIIDKQHVWEQIPPAKRKSFIAYSGIYYTYSFFNVDLTKPDQADLEARVRTVCSETWDQLQKDYPTVDKKYLSAYCADAAYHDQLLYNTYLLNGNQFTVADQINQKGIDWTLGAAFYSLLK